MDQVDFFYNIDTDGTNQDETNNYGRELRVQFLQFYAGQEDKEHPQTMPTPFFMPTETKTQGQNMRKKSF